MNSLVAYFSASGETAKAAAALGAAIQGELYEIRPESPYTQADLDWQNPNSRSSLEMADPNCRPALADRGADIGHYDRIFLGFPIWWYTAPRIIRTFLESYDFSGKTIILFATSGGSGFGRTAQELAASCPGAVIRAGRVFHGRLSRAELAQWAQSL